MNSTLGTAVLRLVIDDKGFNSGIDKAEKSAGGLKNTLGSVAKIASGFVIGAGLLKLPGVISGLVGDASDLNEVLSKSNTVFKDNGKEIERWAEGGAKAFGQSKKQALEAASGFGNMFTQLGIGSDAAADMSMKMVELGSDFASFHNADISEVLNAQAAAFRGEYDAVQRFVPTINAAAVEQEALAQTGKKSTKQLTAMDKAIAAQTLMLKGAGDAMGDFSRTSDGLANRQRILGAEFANLKAKMGNVLLPVAVNVAGFFLNTFVPAITKVADVISDTVGPAISKAKGMLDGFINVMKGGGANFEENGQLAEFAGFVRDTFLPAVKNALTTLRTTAKETFAQFKQYWESDLRPALEAIKNRFEDVVNFVVENWDKIRTVIDPIMSQVENIIKTRIETIKTIFKIIVDIINGDWAKAWEHFKELVQIQIDFVLETLKNWTDLVKAVAPLLAAALEEVGNAGMDALFKAIERAPDVGAKVVTYIMEGMADLAGLMLKEGVKAGEALAKGVLQGIKSIPGMIKDALIPGGGPSLQSQIDQMQQSIVSGGGAMNFGIAPWFGQSAIPSRASGGDASGLTLVGEKGPEIVALPHGSHVFSNEQSQRIGGGVTLNMPNATIMAQDETQARRSAQRYGWALSAAMQSRGVRV